MRDREALAQALVLAWVPLKLEQELAAMKGQSSTWYFIEHLYISRIAVNVTIALSSNAFAVAGARRALAPRRPMRSTWFRVWGLAQALDAV